jgi:gamma-glutamyltranspeptidase/glutathione hydrolase
MPTSPATPGLTLDNFSNSQVIRKTVVSSRGGVVAAQHRRAAEVGAAVLEAGGDAVDAAVATSFAIGVVEPWMSGLAAGGCMQICRADEARAHSVDYGMRSPGGLDPADYPLAAGGKAQDLFAWPLVKDDRNVQGASAVAVPGVVAGMELAHKRFGRIAWRELVAPAVELARQGMLLDWYAGLIPMPRRCSWKKGSGRRSSAGPRSPRSTSTSASCHTHWRTSPEKERGPYTAAMSGARLQRT